MSFLTDLLEHLRDHIAGIAAAAERVANASGTNVEVARGVEAIQNHVDAATTKIEQHLAGAQAAADTTQPAAAATPSE